MTDTVNSSLSGTVNELVKPGKATHFSITGPTSATAGTSFMVTVTTLDAFGNVATGYVGTVKFTSSDNKAVLPANYTFIAGDYGVYSFAVTLNTRGSQSITVADTSSSSFKGSLTGINVPALDSFFGIEEREDSFGVKQH